MNSESSSNEGNEARTRVIVLSGFLGSGKSTAAGQLVRFLNGRGKRAGIITNDHGGELVDSTLFRAQGFAVESLQGGELSGRSLDFRKLATKMAEAKNLDVIIGEPVGTCVNLSEGLMRPLHRDFASRFSFAPLSVMVDPVRAAEALRADKRTLTGHGSDAVLRSQLSEADLIVINKVDQLSSRQLGELRSIIEDGYPGIPVFSVSATTGSGLDEWFDCLMSKDWAPRAEVRNADDVHSQIGWLNCTVSVSSVRYFDAGKLINDVASCVQALLQQEGGKLLRMKLALKPDHDSSDIAAISMVNTDSAPKVLREVSEPIQHGELVLSVRTEGDPEMLHSVVNRSILAAIERSTDLFARMQHCEHFKLGKTAVEV